MRPYKSKKGKQIVRLLDLREEIGELDFFKQTDDNYFTARYHLIGTVFRFIFDHENTTTYWVTIPNQGIVDFSTVLQNVSTDLQDKLLFNIDLFR